MQCAFTHCIFHSIITDLIQIVFPSQSFRRGMNAYLTKHAYKNAFTEDLWDSLGEASGKPVRKVRTDVLIYLFHAFRIRCHDLL